MSIEVQKLDVPIVTYAYPEAVTPSPLESINNEPPAQVGEYTATPEPVDATQIRTLIGVAYNTHIDQSILVENPPLTPQELQNRQLSAAMVDIEKRGIPPDAIDARVRSLPDSKEDAIWQFIEIRTTREIEVNGEKVPIGSLAMHYSFDTAEGLETGIAFLPDLDGSEDQFQAEIIVVSSSLDNKIGIAIPVLTKLQDDGSRLPIATVELRPEENGFKPRLTPILEATIQSDGSRLRATPNPDEILQVKQKGQTVLVVGENITTVQGKNWRLRQVLSNNANGLQQGGGMHEDLFRVIGTNKLAEAVEELKAAESAKALEGITLPDRSDTDAFVDRLGLESYGEDELSAFFAAYDLLDETSKKLVFAPTEAGGLEYDLRLNGFVNGSGEVLRPKVGYVIEYFEQVWPNGARVTLEAPRGYFESRGIPPYKGLEPDDVKKFPSWVSNYLPLLSNPNEQTTRIVFVENKTDDGKVISSADLGLLPIDNKSELPNGRIVNTMAIDVAESIGEDDTLFFVSVFPVELMGFTNLDQANKEKLYATLYSRAVASALVYEYYSYKMGEAPTNPIDEFHGQNGGHPAVNMLVPWPGTFSNYLGHPSIFDW